MVCAYVLLGEWVKEGVYVLCICMSECGCTTLASVCVLYGEEGEAGGGLCLVMWKCTGCVCTYVRTVCTGALCTGLLMEVQSSPILE